MYRSLYLAILLSICWHSASAATFYPATVLASQFNFATSTVPPFPSSTQSSTDTESLLVSQWSLGKGRVQDGPDNLAFVNDPFPNKPPTGAPGVTSSTGPVLQVTYEAGSFSHDTGGAQFYTLWNTTDNSGFSRMMVTYEVAFDQNFDWVKGGKLPGLRGGLNSTGCSGGNKADGEDCFSSRLMWRKGGTGEVYAYIPTPNNLCKASGIICNSDFGVSVGRGMFGFVSGQWTRVTMVVQLNNPVDVANGNIVLYFNDLLAINQTNLQIRSGDTVRANGFYFSTFFGGSDDSWATPVTTHTYFRNVQLWGAAAPSELLGQRVSQATGNRIYSTAVVMLLAVVTGSVFCL